MHGERLHGGRGDNLHADPGHRLVVAAGNAIVERPSHRVALGDHRPVLRPHGVGLFGDGAVGVLEAVVDLHLGRQPRPFGGHDLEHERLACVQLRDLGGQLQVRALRKDGRAEGGRQPLHGNGGRRRIQQQQTPGQQKNRGCRQRRAQRRTHVEGLAEVEPLGLARGLCDDRLPQRGRARPRIGRRLPQELHRAQEPVVEVGETPLQTQRQVGVAEPRRAGR